MSEVLEVKVMAFQVKDILISRVGLEGWEERVAVLSWALRTYPGDQLMADPTLHGGGGNPKVLPLLDGQTVTTLQSEYLRAVSDDYQGTDCNARCGLPLLNMTVFGYQKNLLVQTYVKKVEG